MGEVLPLFALAAALVAILANIALWAPRRLRVKIVALCSLALLLPTLYLSLAELLGQAGEMTITSSPGSTRARTAR